MSVQTTSQDNHEDATTFDFRKLPDELQRRVAGFLLLRDAVNLSMSCKRVNQALSLKRLEPGRLLFDRFHATGPYHTGDNYIRAFRLPIMYQRRVHSVRMEFNWKDQGWGNRKTECRIIAYPISISCDDIPKEHESRPNGRVVAFSSTVAKHQWARLRFTFRVSANEQYYFWYKVGGGGGHVIHLQRATLHTVFFDDRSKIFSQMYRGLYKQGLVIQAAELEVKPRQGLEWREGVPSDLLANERNSFFLSPPGNMSKPETWSMILSVIERLRRQIQQSGGQESDPDLLQQEELVKAFLSHYSLPLTVESLNAMEEIANTDLAEREERRNRNYFPV